MILEPLNFVSVFIQELRFVFEEKALRIVIAVIYLHNLLLCNKPLFTSDSQLEKKGPCIRWS